MNARDGLWLSLLIAGAGCGTSARPLTPGPVAILDMSIVCKAPEMLCGSDCANTVTDAKNCGACGVTCKPGELCAMGACALSCPAGQTACGQSCVNLSIDSANCGACGMACPMGNLCSTGKCGLSCPMGLTECNGQCANLMADNGNCGACGMACPQGNACVMGQCAPQCPMGSMLCNGICVNVQSDNANCGACAKPCAPGSACVNGACVAQCPMGSTLCNGNCVNTQSDDANCGACAAPCRGGQMCVAGRCVLSCAQPLVLCNNACADTRFDPNNCGGCSSVCPGGANAVPTCANGVCSFACKVGFIDCNGNPADGCEANVKIDPKNCGACGVVCQPGAITCLAGVCTPTRVGQYNVNAGPNWNNNPPTYTCQEACALIFGGAAGSYACSTVNNLPNRQAYTSIWGIANCAVAADNVKRGGNYNCGANGCSQSAYVMDNCMNATNYCFR